MAIAKGVSKILGYKKETTWGTLAGASGGKLLRRVTADFNLVKEKYTSSEINPTFMTIDSRHGVRSVDGSLSAELSPGTYSEFIGSILAKDFVIGGTASAMSLTIATSGSFSTLTRAAGSWLTDGFFVGNVIRLTGAGLNAANVGNNLLIVGLTALVATVVVLSNLVPVVPEGPIASVTASVVGKQSYVPLTGHTDQSYTFEQYFSDISQSEVLTGLKPASIALSLPSTGLVTATLAFKGKDLSQTGTSQYFTSPTATNTQGIFAAVSGAVLVEGQPVALITSMNLDISRNQEVANVVGSNFAADIFVGRITVTGSLSVYFQDAVFRNFFDTEAKISLVVALTTGEEKNAEAMTFTMGKVKINTGSKADAELGLTQSMDFEALQNDVITGGLVPSVILVQDTTL